MAVLFSNNAEIGVADGTTVTNANSGGGSGNDAFSGVSAGAGNTFTVTSTTPITGTFSYLLSLNSAVAIQAFWVNAAAEADFSWQKRLRFSALPTGAHVHIFRTYPDAAHATVAYTVFLRTDGKIHIVDTVGGTGQSASSSVALTAGTSYLLQGRSNAGTITVNVYALGSSTLVTSASMTGITPFSIFASRPLGLQTGTSGTVAVLTTKEDEVKVGNSGFLPRTDVTNVAPTVTMGADVYQVVNTVVNLSASDADSDGTVVTRAWTWDTLPEGVTGPTITGASTANATTTPVTPGYYRAKYVVTDDGGLSSADAFMQLFIYPSSAGVVKVRTATLGVWTAFGTATPNTNTGRLNDADATTGVDSATNPTGQALTLVMNPHGPGDITGHVSGNSVGGAITRVLELYKSDGTTLVTSTTLTAPTSAGDQSFAFSTSAVNTAIPNPSDRGALVFKLKSNI